MLLSRAAFRTALAALALAVGATVTPASATDPASPPTDLDYNDPGMHYRAPDGWQRVPTGGPSDDGATTVAYIEKDRAGVRSVVISIASYDGSLPDLVSDRVGKLRGSDSANYVLKREPIVLANGMPGIEIVWTSSSDTTPLYKIYEEFFIDGRRSIDVKYSGLESDVNDAGAASAFSSLYIVAYPLPRRT